MMTGGAGYNSKEARRNFWKNASYLAVLELQANDHLSLRVDTMHLKNRFRDIETNCRNRMHL